MCDRLIPLVTTSSKYGAPAASAALTAASMSPDCVTRWLAIGYMFLP